MGGSTTQSASYMPSGQSGGFPAGPSPGMGRFGGYGSMGQFGGYGGGLGGYGGYGGFGGYGGGFPQTGSGKGFQPMPPPRPQAQYAPMQFLPPQFAQPRFMYPTVAGQMAGQRPVALPLPPVSGGGKGFQGGPRQPMPPGPRPLPIAPPSPGGGPQPFMPGGQQDQFVLPGPGKGSVPEPMPREETEPRDTIQPVRDDARFGNEKFDGMRQMQTLPAQLPGTMRAAVMPREETEPRQTIMPVGGGAYQGDKFSQIQQSMAQSASQNYGQMRLNDALPSFSPPEENFGTSEPVRERLGGHELTQFPRRELTADEKAQFDRQRELMGNRSISQDWNTPGSSQEQQRADAAPSSGSLSSSLLSGLRGFGNAALPVGTAEPARIQPRETIQPVFDETKLQ